MVSKCWHPIVRLATVTALMTTMGLGSTVSAVHAEPNDGSGSPGQSCPIQQPDKSTIYYPPDTKITVVMPDGTTTTYRCDGTTGKWVEVAKLVRVPRAPVTALPEGARVAAMN
jgi:hypothetical protein